MKKNSILLSHYKFISAIYNDLIQMAKIWLCI